MSEPGITSKSKSFFLLRLNFKNSRSEHFKEFSQESHTHTHIFTEKSSFMELDLLTKYTNNQRQKLYWTNPVERY